RPRAPATRRRSRSRAARAARTKRRGAIGSWLDLPGTREHPAALLEDAIGLLVELALGGFDADEPAGRAFGNTRDFARDALPFGHGRHRLHLFELLSERLGFAVRSERRPLPAGAPRRKIAGQAVEAALHPWLGQVLDDLPGELFTLRRLEHHQARAPGERGSRTI